MATRQFISLEERAGALESTEHRRHVWEKRADVRMSQVESDYHEAKVEYVDA